jgi:hypothetical protein
LPFKQNILVKGWQMSGGLTAQSGSPWNVAVGFDQAGNVVAGSERPNLAMPADNIITGSVNQYANPAGSHYRPRAHSAICKETSCLVPAL